METADFNSLRFETAISLECKQLLIKSKNEDTAIKDLSSWNLKETVQFRDKG